MSRKGGAKIPPCAPSAPTIKEKQDRSDLINASYIGDVEWANKLLNGDLDIDRQDSDGYSALMPASREGHTDMVRLLPGKGAQVNLQKRNGKSVLLLASKHGHADVVSLLVDNGANVNIRSILGVRALMTASEKSHSASRIADPERCFCQYANGRILQELCLNVGQCLWAH